MQKLTSTSKPTLLIAGVVVAAVVIVWLAFKPGQSPSPAQDPATAGAEEQTTPAPKADQASAEDTELRPQSAAERAQTTPPAVVIQPISRPAAPPAAAPAPAVPRVEASAYTRQLVTGLTNIDFSHGPITKEQADQWKQGLQTLVNQGAAGVPAIREFLEQNQEMNFAGVNGGDLLGQSSLRSAMINALAQIGGSDATAVMLSTLQSTTLPSEIAQLAQVLEQQAPGQYRQETMNAIQEILGMAGKGQLAGVDVGALFKVLQNYGDPAAAAVLDQLQPEYKYYATMSLAGLQGGAGIPSLVHEAEDPAGGGKRDFAFQMLAQSAGQSPEASAALLQEARLNQIPDSAWRKIAMGLAGDQYTIGAPPIDPAQNPGSLPGLKTYHIQSGNQNFYSLPVGADAQISQRLDFINQLLSATSNPQAAAALQGARDILTGKAPAR